MRFAPCSRGLWRVQVGSPVVGLPETSSERCFLSFPPHHGAPKVATTPAVLGGQNAKYSTKAPFVAMPFLPSSVFAPSSNARSPFH